MRYFISYTSKDQPWAEWIAWQIESLGHEAVIQAWDFLAGSNFVLKMHDACINSDATIIVISKAFLQKEFPAAEWSEAFSKDPEGNTRKLIPVRVENVDLPGLLSTIVYVDLHGTRNENQAAVKLNQGISVERSKPVAAPPFPNKKKEGDKPAFPIKSKNVEKDLQDDIEVEIEIKLNQELESFTKADQENILGAIRELLKTNHSIKVANVKKGSVIITFALKRQDALKLSILRYIDKLDNFKNDNSVIEISNPILLSLTIDEILREYNSYQTVPAKISSNQEGTIVFFDQKDGEGIVLSEYGFYLKFRPEKNDVGMGIGSKVEYASDSVGDFEIIKPPHKTH